MTSDLDSVADDHRKAARDVKRQILALHADSGGTPVTNRVRCARCGYNLIGLPVAGLCPECSHRIADSLNTPQGLLVYPVSALRRVRRATTRVTLATALAALLLLASAAIMDNTPAPLVATAIPETALAALALVGLSLCGLAPATRVFIRGREWMSTVMLLSSAVLVAWAACAVVIAEQSGGVPDMSDIAASMIAVGAGSALLAFGATIWILMRMCEIARAVRPARDVLAVRYLLLGFLGPIALFLWFIGCVIAVRRHLNAALADPDL